MMRCLLTSVVACVILLLAPAEAHIGDRIYLIPELSDADTTSLDLGDGSIADWETASGLPLVQTSDFHSGPPGSAGYDPTDLDYRIWLGWHHGTNRLYLAAQRIDDVYLEYTGPVEQAATEAWRYDEIEFMVDGDHSGGDYTGSADPAWSPEEQALNNNRTAQQFVLHAAPGMFSYMGGAAWPAQPPFGDGGGASVGGGPTTSVYEYYVTPFDDLIRTSAAQSTISPLWPDKIIGFQISMPDYDTTPGNYDGWHTLSGQEATWRFAERFVDARLIADAGTGNNPPVLGSIGPRSATTGIPLQIDLSATDADGDALTFHLSNPPAGGVLTAGIFTWTPSSSQAATYHLLFSVTDGRGGVDSEGVVVTVAQVNHAPVLATIGAQSVAEGATLNLVLSGSDPDGDTLTYSVSGNPAGSLLSGSTFTWTPDYDRAGTYAVTFAVSDGQGGVASETVAITVTEGSVAPSPIKLDLNPVTGDQGLRERRSPAGSDLVLQLVYVGNESLRGYGALLTYDVGQVRLPTEEFAVTQAGWLPVTRSLIEGQLEVGAVVLSGTLGQADLGTLHIHVDNPLAADAEVILSRVVLRLEDGREQQLQVDERVTLKAGGMAGDFNSDGVIDFSDFFLFADAFANPVFDPLYDLDGDGQLDFSDFFLFADLFAQPQQAKLMALAHQYLGLPTETGLESTYPNPFNASTTIRYRLSSSGPTRLEIYALTGQRVAVLVAEPQAPGSHEVTWDGRSDDGQAVATGIYLVRLESAAGAQMRKVSLLR